MSGLIDAPVGWDNEVQLKPRLLALPVLAFWCANPFSASTPTFYDRKDYPLGGNALVIADTNRDGIPDLISTVDVFGVGVNVSVSFGNGDGTFRPGPLSPISLAFGPAWLLARDLNGDGKVDIVIPGGAYLARQREGVGVMLGNGDGTFQPLVYYPTTDKYVDSVTAGDFNNDGILDLAVQGDQGVWLFTGKGNGTFHAGTLIPVSGSGTSNMVASADFNGDGNLDLLATTDSGMAVLLGNGDGTFQSQINTTTRPGVIAIGDLNRDGLPDVAVTSASNEVFAYLGNGDGTFKTGIPSYLPAAAGLAIGDVNGDGILDLVNSLGYVALGKGNGTFKQPAYYPVFGFGISVKPETVALSQLRGNGRLDIVTISAGTFSVLLNQGKGIYLDGVTTQVAGSAGYGVIADFNLDGKLDLAVNNGSGVVVLFGTGKANRPFTIGPTTSIASGVIGPVAGDLNKDGIPDLLVEILNPPPAPGAVVTAYLGKGDGTFKPAASSTSVALAGNMALGDFNGDGKLDYALSSNFLALGNGDGTFQPPKPFASGTTSFTYIVAGDLNGDGRPDIVTVDQFGSSMYIFLNNGNGSFSETTISTQTFCYSPVLPAIADVNGDGSPDITLACVDGSAPIFLNNGQGSFTYNQTLKSPVLTNGALPVVGDLNGDGIPDIGLLESNTMCIYLGTGGGAFAAPTFGVGTGPAPGLPILANLHGQSSAAGTPDIVVPDSTGRVLTILNTTKP